MKTNRTWAECLEAWENYKEEMRTSTDPIIRNVLYKPIADGVKIPMIGICLSVEEFQRFTKEGRYLDQIMGYCESGAQTHDDVRKSMNMGINTIGLTTPRKGYYKILAIHGDNLICYYNHDRGDAFLQEEVEISSKPFFNRASIGPKTTIKVGDIIHVDNTKLVERTWNGEKYSTYSVTWNFYRY